jgi:hypothetical protein
MSNDKCKKCGKEITDQENDCLDCGTSQDIDFVPVMKWISFILGLLGLLIYAFSYSTWLNAIGLILGLLGLLLGIKTVKVSGAKRGLAIAGIVLSVMSLLTNSNPFFDMLIFNNVETNTAVTVESSYYENSYDEAIETAMNKFAFNEAVDIAMNEFATGNHADFPKTNAGTDYDINFMVDSVNMLYGGLPLIKSKYSELSNDPGLVDDTNWMAVFLGNIAALRYCCNNVIEYKPVQMPDEMEQFHKLVILLANGLNEYSQLLVDGFENKDKGKIYEALEILGSSEALFDDIVAEIQP